MGIVQVRFEPGKLDGSIKPRIVLSLVDGNVLWNLVSTLEFNEPRLKVLCETLGAAVPEWLKRVGEARGKDYAERLVLGAK